jgi:adenine phosphoribosyltransferase
VLFRDMTPLLQNGRVFHDAISQIAARFQNSEINLIACVESRGFIIGAALANMLECGVVPIRKKGKLPCRVCSETYDLEYGTDTLEMHYDAVSPGQRVLIVDDVLATGGTAKAVVNIIKGMQGTIVCAAFLLELLDLNGRKKRHCGLPRTLHLCQWIPCIHSRNFRTDRHIKTGPTGTVHGRVAGPSSGDNCQGRGSPTRS